jgi:enoyl-CoA hydratase/carnithine racemase
MAEPATSTGPAVRFSTLPTASGHCFGRATLDAPASLNALSLEMVDLLDAQLVEWSRDDNVVGVVLDASGDKAFCAGGDIVSLYRSLCETAGGQVPDQAARFFEHEYRLDHRIHGYPKPIVCWAHGIVMGGGVGLMAGASHRVATPETRLSMPEVGIGLFPDVGSSWWLPRLPGRLGLFVALTGAPLNALDLRVAGLADIVVPHARRAEVLAAVAAEHWKGDRTADAAQLTRLLAAAGVEDAELAPSRLWLHRQRIDETVGRGTLAEIALRMTTLADDADGWLASAARSFLKGSPTSIALAFEMQRRAGDLSLAEAFRQEWLACVGCCLHPDFREGVRALLVDKDKRPRWTPATLAEVSARHLEAHLRPRALAGSERRHPLADLV